MIIRNRRDALRMAAIVTVVSILVSWGITFLIMFGENFEELADAALPATLTPLLVAPFVSYRYGLTHLRIYEQSLELHRLASEDMLTGLMNRRAFWDAAIKRMMPGRCCTLILFDADFFKKINDTHGHRGGDEALKAVAATVVAEIGRDGIAARVGGEEFAILLLDVGFTEAMATAEKIRRRIEHTRIGCNGATIRMTASFGVAETHGMDTIDELYHLADEALYRAKHRGRNRVEAAGPPPTDPPLAEVA